MYTYAAQLVRVIDADTVVLDIDLGFKLWIRSDSYRLGRVNAPELSTPEGVAAREELVRYLTPVRSLVVTTSRADKYGRWLVELIADGVNVNDWLVKKNFAKYLK